MPARSRQPSWLAQNQNRKNKAMPFAVEMYMDSVSEAAILGFCEAIADAGLSSSVLKSGVRPYVSLALYKKIDLADFRSELELFSDNVESFSVNFTSIATFPTEEGVVFLAPTVTQELLDVHSRFHKAFSRYRPEASEYYLPGQWVPHCTVAMDLKSD
jgi:hypothetical protein